MDIKKALSCINILDDDSCWNWTAATCTKDHNYGHFRINGKNKYAHRFAWEYFVGDIPAGSQVLHTCDNPPCCNPKHLFLGTPADNMHDRDKKGRSGTVGFDDETVKKIREDREKNNSIYLELANKYKCSITTIGNMIRLDTYKWVGK